jgi:hypothetical protein
MSDILWIKDLYRSEILTVVAGRSLGGVLRRMEAESAEWVVVVRTNIETDKVYYYAFHKSELQRLADESPERKSWPIDLAMDMHEWTSSGSSRNRRLISAPAGQQGPAASRIVDFDASGRITAIGERGAEVALPVESRPRTRRPRGSGSTSLDLEPTPLDLGPMRGPRASDIRKPPGPLLEEDREEAHDDIERPPKGTAEQATTIQVTLSADTKAEIQVGAKEVVAFRIELTSEATPLGVSQGTAARPDVKIVVSLSAENGAIEVVEQRERELDPPATGQPRDGYFLVRGVHPGLCRLAVSFRQGGSDLGIIGLAVEVVDAGAKPLPARGSAAAEARDYADDDKLALMVEQRCEGGQIFYEYTLHSEALDLPYRRLRSKPLLDRGGGLAASTMKFVERIYERVTQELKSRDDLKQFARDTRALGANLCQELFDPAVTQLLWPLRDRIKLVQIVSWEPYIPWELVRLRDPTSENIDDRFLAEYGLVRTLSDEPPARTLPMAKLSYLSATYPGGSLPDIGADFDSTVWEKYGVLSTKIAATRDAFYDAIGNGYFDVLHISCHAQSTHQSIEQASLIIGDETVPGTAHPRLIEVDPITVAAEAKLRSRRPLVFLNACETGRLGAVLTDWGGWPNVFLRAGAGAFVGTSWAVRDKPASAFATAFYKALLDGKTLSAATNAARLSAKEFNDASWLAFKVYGHPRARRKT